MMTTGRPWTEAEESTLREHYPSHGSAWNGWACNGGELLPGRSPGAIRVKASKDGVADKRRGCHIWSAREDRVVLRHILAASEETGRSGSSIVHHLVYLQKRARAGASAGGPPGGGVQ